MVITKNMQNYEIKYVNVFDKNKDGQPYLTKNKKPFWRVSLKLAEFGEQYLSGVVFDEPRFKVGEKIELVVSKETYNGKEQLKFELPKKENPNAKANEAILNKLTKIELMVIKIGQHLMPPNNKVEGTDIDYPEDNGDVEF